jgi:hypothetical protein
MDSNSRRPVAPNLTGLTEAARASALQTFEESQERYVNGLLAKPAGSLTPEEQLLLIKGVNAWAKSEGR